MRRQVVLSVVLVSSLLSSTTAMARQSLSSYQQQIHDEIKSGLDAVEQTLGEARARLDAGDASAATSAYNTAVRNYNNHIRRLGQLPAENASVAALREKAQSVSATLKETGDALKAGPTKKADKPADNKDPKPAAPATSKLNYQQEEKLKNARYYLKEVEPRAERVFELASGTLDAEAIAEALDQMKFIQQRMTYAVDNLNALPEDHPDVAVESKRFNELREKLIAAQSTIEKAAPEADKQMAALGKQMEDDLAIVKSWSESLGNPQFLFDNRPEDAIAVVGQLPEMRGTMGTMLERWTARSIQKPNDQTAAEMVRKLKYVDEQLTDLEKYTREQAKSLPLEIDSLIGRVEKLIQTAVTEKRPAYFGPDGGIAQQFGFAEQKLKLLKAIDPAAGNAAETSVAAARETSRAAQKSLSQEIIDGNKKPAERYAGADVEELRKKVIDDWKQAYPNDEIVAVIFNTDGWSRTTRWDWSKGNKAFEKVDYEHIQPKLFYKFDEKHAVEIPVNVYKDYMKDGRLAINPWEKEAEPPVTRLYLLENLK